MLLLNFSMRLGMPESFPVYAGLLILSAIESVVLNGGLVDLLGVLFLPASKRLLEVYCTCIDVVRI